MRFIRYGKFNGLDVSSLNLGDLMDVLSDSLLYSGYDDDYYWTRERLPPDTSLDALRRAILEALLEKATRDATPRPSWGPKIRSTTASSRKSDRPIVSSKASPRTFHQGRPSSTS